MLQSNVSVSLSVGLHQLGQLACFASGSSQNTVMPVKNCGSTSGSSAPPHKVPNGLTITPSQPRWWWWLLGLWAADLVGSEPKSITWTRLWRASVADALPSSAVTTI